MESYRYAAALLREDGAEVGQAPLEVDWGPAREWTRLQALRRARLGAEAFENDCSVEPVWHEARGEPHLAGFRIRLGAEGPSHDFPALYFASAAQEASARLVEQGALKEGERFRFRALAFPGPCENGEGPASRERPLFKARQAPPEVRLLDGTLGPLWASSEPRGSDEADDLPVFVPRRVLEETGALARDAGVRETGGILLGHLRRDREVPEAFVEVTAQIHAREAKGESNRLTFTAEAWTAVRSALELRGRGEIMVGWWHSHPVHEWCKECPEEKRRSCPLAADFLSAHDRALHRTVFPRAYSLALVVNDIGEGGPTHSLFGWREGLLEPRGYRLLEPDPPAEASPAPPLEGSVTHGGRGDGGDRDAA